MKENIAIHTMTMADYDEAMALWRITEGMGLRPADEREPIARYLARNPGFSFVARDGNLLVGTVMCGHDGRRGYLQHLAVARAYRRQGIGRALVQRAVEALRAIDINKCHLFVINTNAPAVAFWQSVGWFQRDDLITMSRWTGALEKNCGHRISGRLTTP